MFAPEIVVLPSAAAVAEALADRTATALRAALAARPRATLALTGGTTAAPAYARLAAAEGLDWARVHVAWGDERAVPPDHPASNYAMARRTLLDPAGVPEAHRHRLAGERAPAEAAAAYAETLATLLGPEGRFDVLHLGMGADGHVASLFPGAAALRETTRQVVATEAPPPAPVRDRLSLTLPALARATLTLVAAAGAAKRPAFLAVLDAYDAADGTAPDDAPPAARLRPDGALVWLVDRDLAQGPDDPSAS